MGRSYNQNMEEKNEIIEQCFYYGIKVNSKIYKQCFCYGIKVNSKIYKN